MMMPSLRNWCTSPKSVIPVRTAQAVIEINPTARSSYDTDLIYFRKGIHVLFSDLTAQWVSCLLLSIR